MIPFPKEFRTFGLWFGQGSDILYGPEPQVMWAGALSYVLKEGRKVLRDFVDRVLKGNYTEPELNRIWECSDADYAPPVDSMRQGFALIRATLDADCKPYYGTLDLT